MEIRRDVFQAIADPTRREIIDLVAHKSLNLNSIAENFDVSRQAISLHIKILTECGLLVIRQQGRERYCEAQFKKLHEVSEWVEKYRVLWNKRLDKMDGLLNELQAGNKKRNKKQHGLNKNR
ncbi:MAG TPA: metalloregulator ArsR/SmtB family transcription factor [Puia sp.]|nr:metalloregulator ArsR/SmtB family transcription factor [Puia sp.]